MATTYTTTVKPSGGDYTSLSAWEAGFGSNTGSHNGNLVTADAIEHAELYAMEDTAVVVLAGWVTDSTRYIKIQPAAGEGHDGKWNAAKYRLTNSGWSAVVINNQQGYTRLIGIQIHHSGGGGSSKGISNPGYAGAIIDSCIVRKSSSIIGQGFSVFGAATGAAPVVVNSVAYGGWEIGLTVSAAFGSTGFSYAYNCTSYGNTLGYRGFYEQRLKNCIGASNTTADFARDGSYPVIQTNCASTDGTADDFTPTNCRVSQTFSFVDPANGDFHLQSSDAGAKDYGTDLSGDSIYPFSTDIDGETRSGTWDIGADEFVAGGASTLLKIYNEAVNSTSGNPRLMAMKRPLGESVSLAEAALRRSALVRLVSSVMGISEGAVKSISALLVRVITETVQAAEGAVRRLFLSRYAGEDLAVTEGVAKRGFLRRVLNGSTAITEGVLKASSLVRTLGETVSSAGAVIKRSALVRLAASTVQAAESTGPVRGFVRVVSEAMSVVEGIVKGAVDALGVLSDNLSVVFLTVRRGVSSISRKRGALSRSHKRGVKS